MWLSYVLSSLIIAREKDPQTSITEMWLRRGRRGGVLSNQHKQATNKHFPRKTPSDGLICGALNIMCSDRIGEQNTKLFPAFAFNRDLFALLQISHHWSHALLVVALKDWKMSSVDSNMYQYIAIYINFSSAFRIKVQDVYGNHILIFKRLKTCFKKDTSTFVKKIKNR